MNAQKDALYQVIEFLEALELDLVTEDAISKILIVCLNALESE